MKMSMSKHLNQIARNMKMSMSSGILIKLLFMDHTNENTPMKENRSEKQHSIKY